MRDWFTCELGASPEAPREAREELGRLLRGRAGTEAVELAMLLVSELVTNAVEHGDAPIRVDARVQDGRLRVAVHDPAGGDPIATNAPPEAISGRGLDIVESLADTWGVEPSSAGFGKAVWFEIILWRENADA